MANLKIVSEPSYTLELNAMELRSLRALVGATSGTSLARAYGKDYDDLTYEEQRSLGTLWQALENEEVPF